ncbi:MAG: hypothetical protein ACI9FN_000277 [Saprospiraceae bacterium]|jgi:hypothetical protein
MVWILIYYWEDNSTKLYNLHSDISETNDVMQKHPELVLQMIIKLLTFLESMESQYAEIDPLMNEETRMQRLDDHKNKLLSKLEAQRREMLSPNWRPNEDWWGSDIK